jgi:D-alanyl-D-alanine endopeptidase (penicillin-binding protein 7)
MPLSEQKRTRTSGWLVGALLVTLAGAGLYVGQDRLQRSRDPAVALNAPQANQPVPAEVIPPEPPVPAGVEVVPEAENAPPPAEKPMLSFGRAAGLHRVKDPLHLVSSAAVAIDEKTGQVLYEKNDEAILPIASLTKLMTAVLITEAKLSMDEEITITDEDVDNERHSRSRLRVGTKLSRGEALHLALMSSENRAAHALGRTFPGGLQQFVVAMNNKAKQVGMKSTTYVDPTGLSNRNQSTAEDLAKLVVVAAKQPLLREYSTTPRRQVTLGGRAMLYNNSNRLVKNPKWDIELQKTGYIVEAGQCMTVLTRVAGRDVVMVLLDATDKVARAADAERIRRWVTAQAAASSGMALAKASHKS